ncbi:MAG: sigma-70 family RNA polymerase sigma factor [Bryobacteraceae bacterium]
MPEPSRAADDVTRLLANWSSGDAGALDHLMPMVYQELHRLASSYLRRERGGHTLQSTALVHEAFLRMVDQNQLGQSKVQWQNRAHFFGIAARLIRQILVDHARGRQAAKRGSDPCVLSLDEALGVPEKQNVDLLALDELLGTLEQVDVQQSRIVEMRFFGGLSIEETAEVLHISPATVKRDWVMAKAWLYQRLTGGSAG